MNRESATLQRVPTICGVLLGAVFLWGQIVFQSAEDFVAARLQAQALGLIPGSHGVRIWTHQGNQEVFVSWEFLNSW